MNKPSSTLDTFCGAVAWRNLTPAILVEHALSRGEARLSADGALVANTGAHTGRSPRDKFIVRDAETDAGVWWDNAQTLQPAQFKALLADVVSFQDPGASYIQELEAGADPDYRIKVRVVSEYAWHALFIRNLLIRPQVPWAARSRDLTILDIPSFRADPARHGSRSGTMIACDFTRGIVLIVGTAYAGEIKKSVFSYLNYVLPGRSVLPMHCSANVGAEKGDVAVFFGLSGTGKTTLSTDPDRPLIGDDEHGWDDAGIFNIEGGCYAKAIHLSAESEPEIFATTKRFATVMENVTLDSATRQPDFEDGSRTENTRIAYPLDAIPGAVRDGRGGQPTAVILLTCDAFGVLPPVARLTPAQAVYHFLSGYTAKIAGTERGVREPEATFSACFGAPFMSRHPTVYGAMLRDRIERHAVPCWMLNTGWSGGGYGVGTRMSLATTRRLLAAVLDGSLARGDFRVDPWFGLSVPVRVEGVDANLLDPAATWADRVAYARAAERLVQMFAANFRRFSEGAETEVLATHP